MLLLSRRVGEAVIIGTEIRVVVLGIRSGQVRIGIKAPRTVLVDREEIYKRKCREEVPDNHSSCP